MDTVRLTILSLEGCKEVKVNRGTGIATITMEEGKTVTKEQLEKLFKETSYAVKKFEQTKGGEDEAEEPEFSSYTATIAGMT